MNNPLALRTTDQISKLVAQRLRELRLQSNLTQGELAGRSGVPFSTYRHLESTGKGSVEILIKVLRALGALDRLDALVEEPVVGPYDTAHQRRRARAARPLSNGEKEGAWQ